MATNGDSASASASAPHQPNDNQNQKQRYNAVKSALLSHEHIFFSPPTSPHGLLIAQSQAQTQQQQHSQDVPNDTLPTISSLSLHPALESVLHLLNCDLPSAHFLCRHAEVEPMWESMYVHGILHRVEGDIDNARCWYGDVKETDAFKSAWTNTSGNDAPEVARKGWENFLDRLERYRDRSRSRQGQGGWEQDGDKLNPKDVKDWDEEERLLRETSLWEFKNMLSFCEDKFGTGKVRDAKEAGAFLGKMEKGSKYAEVAQDMVTGGEGWRTF